MFYKLKLHLISGVLLHFFSINFQQFQEPVSTCNDIRVCKKHFAASKAEECGKLNGHSPTSQSKTLTRTEYK